MIRPGNRKLGPLVHAWSLPAIHTCPGRSPLCESLCYARQHHYAQPAVKTKLNYNYDETQRPEFVQLMCAELRRHQVQVCRVHVAGDFYDLPYLKSWIKIARWRQQTTFFAYTRSWTVPRLLPSLRTLGRLPNVQLWFSADHDMPRPPRVKGIRVCWLARNDSDPPPYKVDLVFRNRAKTTTKRMGKHGSLVCPYEQMVERQVPITCSRCRICFSSARGERTQQGVLVGIAP